MQEKPKSPPALHVAINQGSSRLAQTFVYQLGIGDVFEDKQTVVVHLTDVAQNLNALKGVVKELEVCALPFIQEITFSKHVYHRYEQADYIVLISTRNQQRGIADNLEMFKEQGLALELFAKRTVRVIVVGELANTHAMLLVYFAKHIPVKNITTVTHLAATRGRAVIASHLQVKVGSVKNVIVWGHSRPELQRADGTQARILADDGSSKGVLEVLDDEKWLNDDFVRLTAKLHKQSATMSMAQAIVDDFKDLYWGTDKGWLTSMGVCVPQGNTYSIPPGIFFSLPVVVKDGDWHVLESSLAFSGCMQKKFEHICDQLLREYQDCLKILAARKYAKEHPPPPVVSVPPLLQCEPSVATGLRFKEEDENLTESFRVASTSTVGSEIPFGVASLDSQGLPIMKPLSKLSIRKMASGSSSEVKKENNRSTGTVKVEFDRGGSLSSLAKMKGSRRSLDKEAEIKARGRTSFDKNLGSKTSM